MFYLHGYDSNELSKKYSVSCFNLGNFFRISFHLEQESQLCNNPLYGFMFVGVFNLLQT